MSFGSIYFILIFLPIFLIVVRNVPIWAQKAVVILGGLLFYVLNAGVWGAAIPLTTAVNYLVHRHVSAIPPDGRDAAANESNRRKKNAWTAAVIAFDVMVLAAAKISGFMPLGISFFIFQMISLMADVKDEKLGLKDFCLASMFFPKLIMGPMVRYSDLKKPLLAAERQYMVRPDGLERGLKLYTAGLFMKVVLADNLATLWNAISIAGAYGLATPTAWLGAVGYSLELYLDFWGYSLMAVALGLMLGLPLPENFNEPYSAAGVGEFWRRWHVTLGTWFRDYVYVPLGGNRRGRLVTVRNLFVVWMLTGLWHGITVNYLIWATFLFVFIVLERYTPLGRLARARVIGNAYTAIVIVISWVIFAISDPTQLPVYLKCLFGVYSEGASPSLAQFYRLLRTYWYLIAAGIFFATPLPRRIYDRHSGKNWFILPLLVMLVLSTFFMLHNENNVFMYYAF